MMSFDTVNLLIDQLYQVVCSDVKFSPCHINKNMSVAHYAATLIYNLCRCPKRLAGEAQLRLLPFQFYGDLVGHPRIVHSIVWYDSQRTGHPFLVCDLSTGTSVFS